MAAQQQQHGSSSGPQQPQPGRGYMPTSLPLINGPGRGRGAGPMPPTLLQMPSVYPGNTGGRQPYQPAQPSLPMTNGGWSSLASGVAADLRSQMHAAATQQLEGCARCRLWEGPVQGKPRPPRVDCSQYDGPVIANGDGTQSNWLGLHGWQTAPRNSGKQQAYRQAAPRRRRRGSSGRKRPAAATWDNSDASLSGSDTDESDLSSVPSERGDKEKAVQEWDVPKDLDRPELGDSDEDSEYEAMRRAKERRASGRGRRAANRSTRSRGMSPPAVESAPAAAAAAAAVPAPMAAPPAAAAAPAAVPAAFPPAALPPAALLPAAAATPVAPEAAAAAPSVAAPQALQWAEHAPEAQPEAQPEPEPKSELEFEPEPEPEPIVLERRLSEEEKAADRTAVRSSPDFATILDFFQVFQALLGLSRSFGAAELESVIVASVGDEGLLPDVHMDLLRGIYPRIILGTSNWARHLASKLFAHWRSNMLWKFSDPPFLVAKDEDAAIIYSTLPSLARVQALKALCEMRLDRDDCRGAIEAAAAPKRRRKGEPDDDGPNIEAFRASPLGTDAAGRTYWYHNFYETTGLRLYREAPAQDMAEEDGNTVMATESAGDGSAPAAAAAAAAADSGTTGGASAAAGSAAAGSAAAGSAVAGSTAADGHSDTSAPGSPAQQHNGSAAAAELAAEPAAEPAAEAAANSVEAPSAAAAAKARAAARPKSRSGLARIGGGGRAKAGRGAVFDPPGSQVAEVEGGAWHCVATSVEELEVVGTELIASRKAADLAIASAILEEAVPEAVDAAEAVLRREQRREREVRSLRGFAGAEGAFGRSQRARKPVDYTYSSYDDEIRSVTGAHKGEEPIPRWAADPEIRSSPAEEVAAGLRRGRSHRDAPLQPGLLDERALLGRSRTGTPAASASADAEGSDTDAGVAPSSGHAPQQHTSRLQHVATAAGGQPAPQAELPLGVGAPPPRPPLQVQFPTAAAPLPPAGSVLQATAHQQQAEEVKPQGE